MSWTLKIVDGDVVRYHSNTNYKIVQGVDKLRQECKMILTTNVRRDGVGAGLERILGADIDGEEPALAWRTPSMLQFQQYVRNGISRYRWAQRNYQFNRRTPAELLTDFSPVHVWQDDTDPRKFRWRVDFYTMRNLPDFALGGVTR